MTTQIGMTQQVMHQDVILLDYLITMPGDSIIALNLSLSLRIIQWFPCRIEWKGKEEEKSIDRKIRKQSAATSTNDDSEQWPNSAFGCPECILVGM